MVLCNKTIFPRLQIGKLNAESTVVPLIPVATLLTGTGTSTAD